MQLKSDKDILLTHVLYRLQLYLQPKTGPYSITGLLDKYFLIKFCSHHVHDDIPHKF